MNDYHFIIKPYGFGTLLSFCSMVNYGNAPVKIVTCDHNIKILNFLLENFNLDPSLLQIELNNDKDLDFTDLSDISKIFAPYIKYNKKTTINYQKKFIALGCYRDGMDVFEESQAYQNRFFPKSKQYSVEVYSEIFKLVKKAGYDLITLDNSISLEDKLLFLHKHCDALITYEGGMAHLAHSLGIPVIILPYRYDYFGREESKDLNLAIHFLHVDNMTLILNDIDTILNWNTSDLNETILSLKNYQHNNLLSNCVRVNINEIVIKHDGFRATPIKLNDKEKRYIIDNYKEIRLWI